MPSCVRSCLMVDRVERGVMEAEAWKRGKVDGVAAQLESGPEGTALK
jgi:hypothetical protein